MSYHRTTWAAALLSLTELFAVAVVVLECAARPTATIICTVVSNFDYNTWSCASPADIMIDDCGVCC